MKSLAGLACALGLLVMSGVVVAETASPLKESKGPLPYANGEGLKATYDLVPEGRRLQGVRPGTDASAFAASAEPELQRLLPPGFKLRTRSAIRVTDATEGAVSIAGTTPRTASLHEIEFSGVPLAAGSDLLAVVTDDGRLLASRVRQVPTTVDGSTPGVPAESAATFARSDAQKLAGAAPLTTSRPVLEIWVDSEQKGHLAWELVVISTELARPFEARYWVSALGAPAVLSRVNQLYHAYSGNISAQVWATSSLRSPSSMRAADASVCRNGGACINADANGHFSLNSGTGTATLLTTLQGPFAMVTNQGGTNLTINATGTPTTPFNILFNASAEFDVAQTSAYVWTDFMQHFAAGSIGNHVSLSKLPVNVNINDTCNAFYSPSAVTLNFFRAGNGCANSAYSDVNMHEFGHAIDDSNGGIVDGGYSEGFGDAMAVIATQQACVGRDFFGLSTCLRPADAVILWPAPANSDVHDIGRRYAGFVWELIQQLRKTMPADQAFATAKTLVLSASSMNPSSIPDAVKLSFIADDNDGNLATCSAHFAALAAAADSRHIPRPANCTIPFVRDVLAFIKTSNTPSGHVEVHLASKASNYQTRVLETGTTFANEPDGVWQLLPNQDLAFIKTSNTPNGHVEVHIASRASAYQTRTLETATTFANESDGVWQLLPSQDLAFIKTSNTPNGHVEVHIASRASNYRTRTLETATTFVNETDGVWQLLPNQDLAFIKTSNTPNGHVEVHIASRASNYKTRTLETATTFANENDGVWQLD